MRLRNLTLFLAVFSMSCGAPPQTAAERITRSVIHDGMERSYIVHIPANAADRGPMPVIFAFHPGYATGASMESATALQEQPGAENFVIVYPDGYRRTWNVGYCCGGAHDRGLDDVGLVEVIRRDVATLVPVQERIFATGFSNGALLVYRLLCERPESLAAAAPYGAVLNINQVDCAPQAPVPILHMHGLDDPRAPIEGGATDNPEVGVHLPVASVIDFWSRENQCTRTEQSQLMPGAACTAHRGCAQGAEVILCEIPELGHNWPGERAHLAGRLLGLGAARTDVDGSEAVIEFFNEHR